MGKTIDIDSIESLEQLRYLKDNEEYVVRFTADLDFAPWNYNKKLGALNNKEEFCGFAPIDLSDFKGVLLVKGNDHVIKNIVLNYPEADFVGLISRIGEEAQVHFKDLTLVEPRILGKDHVGALVGKGSLYAQSCKIKKGSVMGQTSVGGFVGTGSKFSFAGCEVLQTRVVGSDVVGALVGAADTISGHQNVSTGFIDCTDIDATKTGSSMFGFAIRSELIGRKETARIYGPIDGYVRVPTGYVLEKTNPEV